MWGRPRHGWRVRGALATAFSLVLLFGCGTTSANPNPGPLNAALRSARARTGAPAAEATIVACGRVVWAGADGVTDLQSRRKINTNTPFVLASTTKTVTATMIMQLVQAGRLSLNTPVARFYPKLPNARRITVRMLLTNTSGLPEYDLVEKNPRYPWTREEVLASLGKPRFPPGEYDYINTNWVVLGGILEQVTRIPIETYFQQMIARPAEMTSSTFIRSAVYVNRMAHPYTRETDGELTDAWVARFGPPTSYWGPVFTDGGLAATATDLARFGNALLRARLLNAKTVAQMTDVGENDYGFGIASEAFNGRRWLGHDGVYGGSESQNWTDRSRQLTIAITTNLEEAKDQDAEARGKPTAGVSEKIRNAVAAAYDRTKPPRC